MIVETSTDEHNCDQNANSTATDCIEHADSMHLFGQWLSTDIRGGYGHSCR